MADGAMPRVLGALAALVLAVPAWGQDSDRFLSVPPPRPAPATPRPTLAPQ